MPVETAFAHPSDLTFERLPVLSQIENDRFCDCGYNLRMQGVRRDPRLDLLLVRCPECNRFHPVALAGTPFQVWVQRLCRVLLFGYACTVVSVLLGLGAAQVGITVASVDELSRRSWSRVTMSNGGFNYVETGLAIYQQPDHEDYRLIMGFTIAGSLATGYAGVALAAVCCHHWRRWGYVALAAVLPLLVAVIVWCMLVYAPQRLDFADPYVGLFAGIQFAGGLLAVLTARPLTRLTLRLFLPNRLLAYVAFLWTADGLPAPMRGVRVESTVIKPQPVVSE